MQTFKTISPIFLTLVAVLIFGCGNDSPNSGSKTPGPVDTNLDNDPIFGKWKGGFSADGKVIIHTKFDLRTDSNYVDTTIFGELTSGDFVLGWGSFSFTSESLYTNLKEPVCDTGSFLTTDTFPNGAPFIYYAEADSCDSLGGVFSEHKYSYTIVNDSIFLNENGLIIRLGKYVGY